MLKQVNDENKSGEDDSGDDDAGDDDHHHDAGDDDAGDDDAGDDDAGDDDAGDDDQSEVRARAARRPCEECQACGCPPCHRRSYLLNALFLHALTCSYMLLHVLTCSYMPLSYRFIIQVGTVYNNVHHFQYNILFMWHCHMHFAVLFLSVPINMVKLSLVFMNDYESMLCQFRAVLRRG